MKAKIVLLFVAAALILMAYPAAAQQCKGSCQGHAEILKVDDGCKAHAAKSCGGKCGQHKGHGAKSCGGACKCKGKAHAAKSCGGKCGGSCKVIIEINCCGDKGVKVTINCGCKSGPHSHAGCLKSSGGMWVGKCGHPKGHAEKSCGCAGKGKAYALKAGACKCKGKAHALKAGACKCKSKAHALKAGACKCKTKPAGIKRELRIITTPGKGSRRMMILTPALKKKGCSSKCKQAAPQKKGGCGGCGAKKADTGISIEKLLLEYEVEKKKKKGGCGCSAKKVKEDISF